MTQHSPTSQVSAGVTTPRAGCPDRLWLLHFGGAQYPAGHGPQKLVLVDAALRGVDWMISGGACQAQLTHSSVKPHVYFETGRINRWVTRSSSQSLAETTSNSVLQAKEKISHVNGQMCKHNYGYISHILVCIFSSNEEGSKTNHVNYEVVQLKWSGLQLAFVVGKEALPVQ